MVQDDKAVGLDATQVKFDDERAVSDAGVMLVATLAQRLGIEALAGDLVRLRSGRPGAANGGRKVMALIFAMVLGADSIDDTGVLRAGRTGRLLGGWIPAPSTLGTFLRAFTFGHVRQLDALLGRSLERAWRAGAGPGDRRLIVDVDSFVGEVCGYAKQGAAYGYTKLFGYHPILATRADTREALHIRLRKGSANTQKGMLRSARNSSPASTALAPAARSCSEQTPAFGTPRSSSTCTRWAGNTRSASGTSRPSRRPWPRSTRPPGRTSPTPPQVRRRSPKRSTADGD
jgi:hypothetical protein